MAEVHTLAARHSLALADFLRRREEEILAEWEQAVRELPGARSLDHRTLIDDLPALIHHFADLAERGRRGGSLEELDDSVERHVRARLEEGFDLTHIIAEFTLLRDAIIRLWGPRSLANGVETLRLLNLAIDGTIRVAIARYSEERHRTLQALDRISTAALESTNLQALLEKLLGVILETTAAADTAAILLREGDRLVTRAAVGLERHDGLVVEIGHGFAGKIAAERRERASRSAATDPLVENEIIRARGVRALYGVPLLDGDELIGVAYVGSLTTHEFSDQDRRLFNAMASRAVAGIQHHMLHTAAERRVSQQQAVAELGLHALSSEDLAATIDEAVATVSRVLGATHVAVVAEPPGEDGTVMRAVIRGPDVDGPRYGTLVAELGGGAGEKERADDLHFLQSVANVLACAIARDRLIEAQRKARAESEEAVETRDQFMATVSHDLKNPLGAVMMSSAMLLKSAAFDERAVFIQKNAEIIQRAAQRMNRLLHDLVDLAAIQAKRLSIRCGIHDPRELVVETVDTFQSIADERGISLQAQADGALPRINFDRDRILQVLGNLVTNAVKATEREGRVEVRAEPRAEDVLFTVRDTGRGISPEELPHIFDRYRRGKAAGYKGSGLGLAIASGIVQAHGGRIWAESTPGEGSSFYFTLPLEAVCPK